MIDFVGIENTLKLLEQKYDLCLDTQLSILYSKLSVLELCGWMETSIDIILYEYIETNILSLECKDKIKKIVKKNYGFDYDTNLFPLLCSVLGVNNLENILDVIPISDLQNLKNITNAYQVERNKAAHTDTPEGTTRTYRAPSCVLRDFCLIKSTFSLLEREIQNL